jgi:tubby-related protein 1
MGFVNIHRQKGGKDRFHPQYELFIENGDNTLSFLMSAKKRKLSKSSNYVISSARSREENIEPGDVIAKVRSNFVGTNFIIYDNGVNPLQAPETSLLRKELASISYEQNILGYNGYFHLNL